MRKRIPFFLFLLAYVLFSLATFRDYGPTWDEQDTYQEGANLYGFLIQGKPLNYLDPEHSYPYAFLLHFFVAPDRYEVLHLANLLLEGFLFWALFEVLFAFSGSALWALAGPVFLFLDLPFLGSIPANPKDIPFALFYVLSLTAMALFQRWFPNLRFRWFFLGLLFGLTVATRILGFTLFPLLVLYDLFLVGRERKGAKKKGIKTPWASLGLQWAGTLAVSQFLCALLWPFLGQNYWKHLPVVLQLSAHFPPKFAFLFMGGTSDSLSYPWFYLPLLIVLTTPLFLLAFFLFGLTRAKARAQDPLYLLFSGALILNLGLYLFLHPAIYDGLRHFLFLLPILVVLAAMGFVDLFRVKKWEPWRKGVAVLVAASALATMGHLVRLHPYEYTYFNELAGGLKGAYGKYETDYWAASLKEAALWLKANEIKDPAKTYKVYADGKAFQSQSYFSPQMQFVPSKTDADYALIMTRFGFKPDAYEEPRVIHQVEREGVPLSFVVKLR